MNAAGLVLLSRLMVAGPQDCTSEERSGGRALSDQPYGAIPTCSEEPPETRTSGATLPGNAAQDGSMSENRRVGFGLVGTGASLVVLGASLLACSRLTATAYERSFCRNLWPWFAGTGAALGGVGFGVVAYTSSENERAGSSRASRLDWTIGPTVSLALP